MSGNGKKPNKYIVEYRGRDTWLYYMETEIFNLALAAYRTAIKYHKARMIQLDSLKNRKVLEVE